MAWILQYLIGKILTLTKIGVQGGSEPPGTTWWVPILVSWWWWWWSRGVAGHDFSLRRSPAVVVVDCSVPTSCAGSGSFFVSTNVELVVAFEVRPCAVFPPSVSPPSSSPLSRLCFWSSLKIGDSRDDDPSCPRPSYDDGRLCSSFLLVTCVPCLPYVIQNQSGDSRLGQECFVIG